MVSAIAVAIVFAPSPEAPPAAPESAPVVKSEVKDPPPLAETAIAKTVPPQEPPAPTSTVLKKDETVTGALLAADFTAGEAAKVVAALDKIVDFRQVPTIHLGNHQRLRLTIFF